MFARASGSTNGAGPHDRPARLPDQRWVDWRDSDGVVVLTVRGEIDLGSAPVLDAQLQVAQASARRVVVDLEEVEFFDCHGLRVLLDAKGRSAPNQHQLVLRGVPPRVRRVFEATGTTEEFSIVP